MLTGIDISSHQKDDSVIDNQEFVIIKATEGNGYKNERFDAQLTHAIAKGKLIGFYHYSRPDLGNTPEAEADWFLSVVGDYVGKSVLALDHECANYGGWIDWVDQWLDYVIKKTGVRPLFYTMGLYASQFKAVVQKHNVGVWTASDVDYYAGMPIVMTQSVSDLDHDCFYGDSEAWKAYATGGKAVTEAIKTAPKLQEQEKQQPQYVTYTVRAGDTLSGIAAKYGTTYQHLAEINGLADPNYIRVGQVLKIKGTPPLESETTYVVKSGDTLSGIAARFHTTWQKLAQLNGLKNPSLIYPYQTLKVK